MDDTTAITRILILLIIGVTIVACIAIGFYHWRDVSMARAGYRYEYQGSTYGWYPEKKGAR